MSKTSSEPTKLEKIIPFLDAISDPTRARIYLEILIHERISTLELQELIPIGRSTLGHHLTKLVNVGLVTVEVAPTGRAVKYYSPNHEFIPDIDVNRDGIGEDSKVMKSDFNKKILETVTSLLVMTASLAKDSLRRYLRVHDKSEENPLVRDFKAMVSSSMIPVSKIEDAFKILKETQEAVKSLEMEDLSELRDEMLYYNMVLVLYPIFNVGGKKSDSS